ncbi:MAG: Sapep family Mn(2+)-dependent dipeptidase [Fimbriimonadales bacterium]
MSDATVARLHQWLKDHEQDLLNDTIAMLRIPSIEGPAEPNAPYGSENRRALDFALELGEKWGMRTKDVEGHIGFAEFGDGERLVMTLGHLDVVPVGPGWKYEPFGAEIVDGYIYARGSTDDKGPTMAAFYAARAIKECVPELGARMRVVFGCDEESGFGCVHRYMETEEAPTYGVAPDSDWPLIHAEKGIANFLISVPLNNGEFAVQSVEGGQRPNIVIDSCVAKVKVADSARAHVEEKLARKWDRNVEFSWSGDVLEVRAAGKASHGAMPYLGDSAAARIFRFLLEIAPLSAQKYLEELLWMTHPSGLGLGIHGRDDVSKDLTSNMGIVETRDGVLKLTINVRYPVTWKGDHLRSLCETHLKDLKSGATIEDFHDSPSLYFPLDHPLVKAICEVYTAETGDTERKPGVMGGGTYARAVPNTVSIGTCWEGDGHAHETDERVAVESLYKASRIFAHLFYKLATMP